jgi:hypothetical protein
MFYFQDEGIWFDEEDPTSDCYKPECCTNVYLDCAKGKFDTNDGYIFYDNKKSKNKNINTQFLKNVMYQLS